MKRMILGAAVLAVLALPQAAFSKASDAGSGGAAKASSQRQYAPATPNFNVNGTGTAVSCGSGCTQVSGNWASNGSAGTFTARLTETAPVAGCAGLSGSANLLTGSDSLLLGIVGTRCGAAFTGKYDVTDGTGAYQESGVGWGQFTFTTTANGAFRLSSHGTFYAHVARQTGLGMGG